MNALLRYDWQEFFFGHGGLSTRWTEAHEAPFTVRRREELPLTALVC